MLYFGRNVWGCFPLSHGVSSESRKRNLTLKQRNGLSEQGWNQLNHPGSSFLVYQEPPGTCSLSRQERTICMQWRQEDNKSLSVEVAWKIPKASLCQASFLSVSERQNFVKIVREPRKFLPLAPSPIPYSESSCWETPISPSPHWPTFSCFLIALATHLFLVFYTSE